MVIATDDPFVLEHAERCWPHEVSVVRFTSLLREALSTAWANEVRTALVALLVGIMCATTLATVGRTAAAGRQVADRLDTAGHPALAVHRRHCRPRRHRQRRPARRLCRDPRPDRVLRTP